MHRDGPTSVLHCCCPKDATVVSTRPAKLVRNRPLVCERRVIFEREVSVRYLELIRGDKEPSMDTNGKDVFGETGVVEVEAGAST